MGAELQNRPAVLDSCVTLFNIMIEWQLDHSAEHPESRTIIRSTKRIPDLKGAATSGEEELLPSNPAEKWPLCHLAVFTVDLSQSFLQHNLPFGRVSKTWSNLCVPLSWQECIVFCVREEPVLFLRVDDDFVPYTPRGKENLHENLHSLQCGVKVENLELAIRKEVILCSICRYTRLWGCLLLPVPKACHLLHNVKIILDTECGPDFRYCYLPLQMLWGPPHLHIFECIISTQFILTTSYRRIGWVLGATSRW